MISYKSANTDKISVGERLRLRERSGSMRLSARSPTSFFSLLYRGAFQSTDTRQVDQISMRFRGEFIILNELRITSLINCCQLLKKIGSPCYAALTTYVCRYYVRSISIGTPMVNPEPDHMSCCCRRKVRAVIVGRETLSPDLSRPSLPDLPVAGNPHPLRASMGSKLSSLGSSAVPEAVASFSWRLGYQT